MRWLLVRVMPIAIGAVVLAGAYGFTAHNTVSSQQIGAGRNDISGYNVQVLHVNYIIPPPNYIYEVIFQMDPAPHTVQVWFDGGSGNVYTNTGTTPSCTISGDVVDCTNMHESDVTTTAMHVAGSD